MKKVFLCVLIAVMAIMSMVIVSKVNTASEKDSFLDANVEALSDPEIIVGGLCAYDVMRWCIYFDPYEEIQGVFI